MNSKSFLWRIFIVLDTINISSNLTANLRIEAEEGTAKIAEFTVMPFSGPISVSNWIGKPVEIQYCLEDANGNVIGEYLLFKGVVDEPIYDPTTRLTTFTCTDQLQEKIENLSRLEIDALIGGHWSPHIFDEQSDNWTYARNRLSTIPVSLDLDKSNEFKLMPWESKVTADFTFTDDEVLYQQTQVQLANRRTLHNQVNIRVQYRYQRLKQRELHYEYRYPMSLCEQLGRNATMPNTEMVQQAVMGTDWRLQGNIDFVNQHPGGVINCDGNDVAFVIPKALQQYLIRDASFTLTKRFHQTVTESYDLQLEAPQSMAQIGIIPHKEHTSLEIEADVERFKEAHGPLFEAIVDAAGDKVIEVEDRAQLTAVTETLLHQSKTSVLEAHRQNLITFKTVLHPLIERHHTAVIDMPEVKAQGKVKHIIHECDFNQGSSITTITIAVSRTDNDTKVNDSDLIAPEKPATLGEPKIGQNQISLPTHFGGEIDSDAYDNTWEGYTGNYQIQPGATAYPERFMITTPEIEAAQAPIEYQFQHTYQMNIPNEPLSLSA